METRWRTHFRDILWIILLLTLIPLSVSAAPTETWHYSVVTADPPNPGSGWGSVTQLLVGSGCSGTSCGSSWRPRDASYTILLENAGDRITKAHGSGDGSPPYNATVVFRRQTCPPDGAWGAGTWHHNFQAASRLEQTSLRVVQNGEQTIYFITLTQRWSSRYYQSFAHNDSCFSTEAITPTPTPTQAVGGESGSDPSPTIAPGQPTPTPLPTPTEIPTPLPINPCTGGGQPIPDASYSVWTPIGLATSAPGPVLTTTVALTFQQTPIGFGLDLKAWNSDR